MSGRLVLGVNDCFCRLEKLAEVFYTYVGDLQPVADAVELDVDTVDVIFQYWILKRKVITRVLLAYFCCCLLSENRRLLGHHDSLLMF